MEVVEDRLKIYSTERLVDIYNKAKMINQADSLMLIKDKDNDDVILLDGYKEVDKKVEHRVINIYISNELKCTPKQLKNTLYDKNALGKYLDGAKMLENDFGEYCNFTLNVHGGASIENFDGLFSGICCRCIDINDLMLDSCKSLTRLFGSAFIQEVKCDKLDTSNVEDFSHMFENFVGGAEGIKKFNTSNAKLLNSMFYSATMLNRKGYEINGWDVSKVDDFEYIFGNVIIPGDLDISSWKTHDRASVDGFVAGAKLHGKFKIKATDEKIKRSLTKARKLIKEINNNEYVVYTW